MTCYPFAIMQSLVEIIAKSTEFLKEASENANVSKEDVCDGMHMRLSILMSKVVSYPMCTQFALPLDPGPGELDNDNERLRSFFTRTHECSSASNSMDTK